jgi:hypothetical protein
MRVVAFAYSDAIPRLSPIYRGLAEGLCANVKEVMPGVKVVHVTDKQTAPLDGPDERLEVARDVPLMTWHMKCHQEAQALGDEVLFTEPDVRFRSEILHVFDDPDFDIAVTEREVDSTWSIDGKKVLLSDIAPYTLGTTFSRSAKFWEEVTAHCATLGDAEQHWIGDMLSLYAVMQTGKYRVKVIPGPIYNHIPCSREDCCDVKVLHYKGMRKEWLFQGVREAA